MKHVRDRGKRGPNPPAKTAPKNASQKAATKDYKQIEGEIFAGIERGNVEAVRRLLRSHPDHRYNYCIGNGTWLHQAAGNDDLPMVKMLVAAGIAVNAPRKTNPGTPLAAAASSGSMKVAKWLLDHGAIIDAGHCPPLAAAATSGSVAMVKLLLKRKANVNLTYGEPPRNALSQAVDLGHEAIEDLLRAHGALEPNELKSDNKCVTARDEIFRHIRKHIGPIGRLSLMEIVPTGDVLISVHVVPASKRRPYLTLFTTGMSDKAMKAPKTGEDYRFAELLIQLPADWPLTQKALKNPTHFWPIEWMRRIAYYPHENDTWLGGSYAVIANGDPPKPFALNTKFTAILLLSQATEFGTLKIKNGKSINFYTMVPLYTEERDLELAKGTLHLLKMFQKHDVDTTVDIDRLNVAKLSSGVRRPRSRIVVATRS